MQIQTEEMRRAMGEADMARYSLKTYGKRVATNAVKGRFFTSKPMGLMHRSRVPRP